MKQESGKAKDKPEARRLGVDVTMAQDGDFGAAIAQAKRTGATVASLSLPWDEIETGTEEYAPEKDFLTIANGFYPKQNLDVTLAINPLDMNRNRLPTDLKGKQLDDPEVIARYCRLLDYVLRRTARLRLTCLVIGNEINLSLGDDVRRWEQFKRFFRSTSAYARRRRRGLKVGSKITFRGMTGDESEQAASLARHADVLMATYYPLNADFTVQASEQVRADFARMAKLSHDAKKPLYLLECGYPSGAVCLSSESVQAEFVRTVFQSWDSAVSEVPVLSFTWLTDIPEREVRAIADGFGFSTPAFRDYLGTLGLRTYPGKGTDKEAFRVLVEEGQKRFPTRVTQLSSERLLGFGVAPVE